jgi:hypothetical protein
MVFLFTRFGFCISSLCPRLIDIVSAIQAIYFQIRYDERLDRIGEEAAVTQFKVRVQHYLGQTEDDYETVQPR